MKWLVLLFLVMFAVAEAKEADASSAEAKQIQAALARYAGDVHGCYGRALAPDQKTAGEVLVRVTIGQAARVDHAEILEDRIGSPALAECLTERMLAWNLPGIGTAGTQVIFPLIFKPGGPQYAVRIADVEPVPRSPVAKPDRPPRVLPLQTWLLLDEKSVGLAQASMLVVQVGPKAKVSLHRHPHATELIYILDGAGRLLIPGAAPTRLEEGTAVLIPEGEPHSFDVQSPQKTLRFLQVFVPPGPEAVLRDRSQGAGTEVLRSAPAKAPGAPKHRVVKESDKKPLAIAQGKGRARLLFDSQSGGVPSSLGVIEIEAHTTLPEHEHPGSAELLYVLGGKGTMRFGTTEVPLSEGTALYVPADMPHSATFTERVRAIQVYVPPGPELRYLKGAAQPAHP